MSVLVPAYREGGVLGATLEALHVLDYPDYEVVVVDDGSPDGTAEVARRHARRDPRFRLLRKKVNEGKALAMNDAVPLLTGEIVVVVDAAARLRPDALRPIVAHFVRLPRVAAVTGNPRGANRTTLLAELQTLDFTSIVSLLRRAQVVWGRMLTVPGVISAFRVSALRDVGLFDPSMATEDIDVSWRLQRAFYDIRYEPRALVDMTVPGGLGCAVAPAPPLGPRAPAGAAAAPSCLDCHDLLAHATAVACLRRGVPVHPVGARVRHRGRSRRWGSDGRSSTGERPRSGPASRLPPVVTSPPPSHLRTLQRVVLPPSPALEVLPLYVTGSAGAGNRPTECPAPDQVVDRRRLRIPGATTCSFATYFNAFPASYWQRWSRVDEVELAVRLSAAGTVTVWASNGAGDRTVVRRETSSGGALSFSLPLADFDDGGWYWFDVTAAAGGLVVEGAEWRATTTAAAPTGGVTIGVTTLDRPSYVVDVLSSLGAEPAVLETLDQVIVVDQGQQRVREQPGFGEVQRLLGGRLHVLEQPNLGGSGGFARSMSETLQSGRSRYLLLMDDDVVLEPESVLRARTFADLARQPMLVGGHMFDLDRRTRLHSFGEVVRPERYEWGPADGVETGHDFAARDLAGSPWMHRRFDVDYTAWWMCLIPVEVLGAVGLSAPFFIAWDDAEFGVRAAAYGYPTVTLPGMAIWHMPFTAKADASDWKAYFEQRNRLVTALLHSPSGSARGVVGGSAREVVRALLSMQYAAAELRLAALEDLFDDPAALHRTLPSRLPEVRALRSRYSDARISQDLQGFPATRDQVVGRTRGLPRTPSRPAKLAVSAYGALRQVRAEARGQAPPQALLPAAEAVWWRLALLDSALVWSRDDAGVRSYQRERAVFLRLLRRTVVTHGRLMLQWDRLRRRYRASWREQTSPEAWRRSLASAGAAIEASPDAAVRDAEPGSGAGRGDVPGAW